MACPYFIPTDPHERELWPHRYRLSLGDGFAGQCAAQTPAASCNDEALRGQCNLGYAECVHLPAERAFDAVRFLFQSQSEMTVRVQFACERTHLPALCGELRYDRSLKVWLDQPDPRLLLLADAAVHAWIQKDEKDATH